MAVASALAIAVLHAGCGDGRRAAVLAGPTTPTIVPAPVPRPAPHPPAVPGALTGTYQVTFAADARCEGLPEPARVRRYDVAIAHVSDREIIGTLSGGDFQPGYDTFWGFVTEPLPRVIFSSRMAFDAWLEGQPIIDRLSPAEMVTIMGDSSGPIAWDVPRAFRGEIAYCAAAIANGDPWWPATCAAPTSCRSDAHTVTFSRR